MIYQVGLQRTGRFRELYLIPGVVLSVFDAPDGGGRCRLRRVLRARAQGPDLDRGGVEALVEWLDPSGRRTGRLSYLPLAALFPDVGARTCEVPRV